MAAPAVAATAPTAIDNNAIVAADLRIEYRDFLVPSSTIASRVNHTFPGYLLSSSLCLGRQRTDLELDRLTWLDLDVRIQSLLTESRPMIDLHHSQSEERLLALDIYLVVVGYYL
jgi:hypothetical protein